MLSVQQLQRAIKVIYETEQERQILWGNKGSQNDPFSLGYFVGKSSTPNQLSNAEWAGKWKISQLASQEDIRNQLRLVRKCPRCDKNAVEIVVDEPNLRIKHGKRVIPVIVDEIWNHPDVKSGEFAIPNWMTRANWLDFRKETPENTKACLIGRL